METAKLSVKGLAVSLAIVWGGCVLFVAIANAVWPGYAQLFLDWVASFYPGYDAMPSVGSIILVTCYALADGFIGGLVIALIYNLCAGCKCKKEG